MMKTNIEMKVIISYRELLKSLNLKGKISRLKTNREWTGKKWKEWIEIELEGVKK